MKSNRQESFKNTLSFYSNNPMMNSEKDKNDIGLGNKNGNNKKGLKDEKSAKSVKSDINNQNTLLVSNIQLEKCMRFIVNHDSSNASKELCSMLVDIVVKICSVKSTNSLQSSIETTNNSAGAASSLLLAAVPTSTAGTMKPPMRPTSSKNNNSSRSNNNINSNSTKNKDNPKNKQKLKPWDNLLAAEKFLVDEICSFFGDTIGGSRVVSEKLDIPLGAIATQYWRVSDGKSFFILYFIMYFILLCILFYYILFYLLWF